MNIKGKILQVFQEKQYYAYYFLDYLIETEDGHKILLTLDNKLMRIYLAVGATVISDVEFRARQYKGKWINSFIVGIITPVLSDNIRKTIEIINTKIKTEQL